VVSSPIEWPILAAGVAGLVMITTALVIGARRADARGASRLAMVGLWLALTPMFLLTAIDLIVFHTTGDGVIVGFYWICVLCVYFIVFLGPVGLWVQHLRRKRGWPLVYAHAPEAEQ